MAKRSELGALNAKRGQQHLTCSLPSLLYMQVDHRTNHAYTSGANGDIYDKCAGETESDSV